VAIRAFKDKYGKEILKAGRDQFPISHQPTAQEREDHYRGDVTALHRAEAIRLAKPASKTKSVWEA